MSTTTEKYVLYDEYNNTISVKVDYKTIYGEDDEVLDFVPQLKVEIDYGKGKNLSVYLDRTSSIHLSNIIKNKSDEV